jgi:hypothetical protein
VTAKQVIDLATKLGRQDMSLVPAPVVFVYYNTSLESLHCSVRVTGEELEWTDTGRVTRRAVEELRNEPT